MNIQRWCVVNEKTGEVIVQEEPAPNPQTAEIFREQEKGVVTTGNDFQAVFKSSAATSFVSLALIVVLSLVYLF